ncbi:MAG: tyrosine-type recombinase/integrase [Eubacteriales bacterium]|nr:tyrosine-type recombinase/integrase [Eubacteriales bacterium]
MARIKDEQLFIMIRNFLTVYLPVQRNTSDLTVQTYRTALNQFLDYLKVKKQIALSNITFDMFNQENVNGFLDMLTTEKNRTPSTRNNRLAAIRSFVSYASACRPEYLSISAEISTIKSQKNDPFAKVDYMTENAVKALFNKPDIKTEIGLRDLLVMILLYDTGARIQELLAIRLCDLKLDDNTPTVKIFGKGKKIRIVPLMKDTVMHLKNYLSVFHKGISLHSDMWLFYVERRRVRNQMCDDTVRERLKIYASSARTHCSEVPTKVHPHLWRHTRAMHLYQHGMDLTLISQWLGHSNIETTLIYAHADTEDKRKAIERAMADGVDVNSDVENSRYTVTDDDLLRRLYGL